MTHLARKSKLQSVVRSSLYPCPGNWVEVWWGVVYYDRDAQVFSAGIKCCHCIYYITSHLYDKLEELNPLGAIN